MCACMYVWRNAASVIMRLDIRTNIYMWIIYPFFSITTKNKNGFHLFIYILCIQYEQNIVANKFTWISPMLKINNISHLLAKQTRLVCESGRCWCVCVCDKT